MVQFSCWQPCVSNHWWWRWKWPQETSQQTRLLVVQVLQGVTEKLRFSLSTATYPSPAWKRSSKFSKQLQLASHFLTTNNSLVLVREKWQSAESSLIDTPYLLINMDLRLINYFRKPCNQVKNLFSLNKEKHIQFQGVFIS